MDHVLDLLGIRKGLFLIAVVVAAAHWILGAYGVKLLTSYLFFPWLVAFIVAE